MEWHIETVDESPCSGWGVGRFAWLALDGMGRPHISYCDWHNGDLKYARHDGRDWQIETVDSDGCVGPFTSLALDRFDRSHISYYCDTYGPSPLKYAWLPYPHLLLDKQATPSDELRNNDDLTYTLTPIRPWPERPPGGSAAG